MKALVRPRVFLPVLLAASGALSLWYAGRSLPFSDEGAVLTAAAKILRGGVFYREIDAYWAPGSAYLLAGSMAVFGEHLSVARGLALLFFCITVGSLYLASLALLDRGRAALFGLSLLSLKFLGWPAFSVYIYSDVAFAFACTAIALLLHAPSRRAPVWIALAGLCIGLSAVAKQNLGVYLAVASLFVLWRRSDREWLPFAAGLALPTGGMALGFTSLGLLGPMLESTVLRPFTGYLPASGLPFAPMLAWWELGSLRDVSATPYLAFDYAGLLVGGHLPGESQRLWWLAGEVASRLVYTAVPVAFAWVALRVWRERGRRREGRAEALVRATPLAGAAVLSAFPRADFFHVISVFPLVALLLFALVQPPADRPRPAWPEAVAVAVLLLACGTLAVVHRAQLTHRLTLARADVWVEPGQAWLAPLVEGLEEEVPPGGRLFVFGHEAHLYFLTGRFYPWPFSQLYPGQAGADQGRRLARLLVDEPPVRVVRGVQDWPGQPPIGSYAPALASDVATRFPPDPDFFVRHPLPAGAGPPPAWIVEVRRPEGISGVRRGERQ